MTLFTLMRLADGFGRRDVRLSVRYRTEKFTPNDRVPHSYKRIKRVALYNYITVIPENSKYVNHLFRFTNICYLSMPAVRFSSRFVTSSISNKKTNIGIPMISPQIPIKCSEKINTINVKKIGSSVFADINFGFRK